MKERTGFSFFNAHYVLDPAPIPDTDLFESVWIVRADPTYQVMQPKGFQVPGMFCTFQGQGRVRLVPQDRTIDLPPCTLLAVDRKVQCYYECPAGGNWHFFFIHCWPDKLFRELGLEYHVLYQDTAPDAIVRCGEEMVNELIRKHAGFRRVVRLRLEELLVHFARLRHVPRRESVEGVERVVHWMNYNLDQPLRIKTAMDMAGLGRTVLFREFKKRTGQTPVDYFLSLKLRSARLTLETTRKKVAAIAASLGFYDEYHFSKMFKRVCGVSPARYRRQHLQTTNGERRMAN